MIAKTYEILRETHGVMDSIRFTADLLNMSAWQVADELGLSNYYISQSF